MPEESWSGPMIKMHRINDQTMEYECVCQECGS